MSLVKGQGDEHKNSHTFASPISDIDLLRSMAIYGPNAAGKSNIIKALAVMRQIVLKSSNSQRGDQLSVEAHLFDSKTESMPTEFEVVFIVDSIRYQYGFSATTDRIHDEWLFAFPKGRSQRWIERGTQNGITFWNNGEKLTGEKKLWETLTRDNVLFLSRAIQLNSQQLAPVFDWFKSKLRVIGFEGADPAFTANKCQVECQKEKVLDFLKAADLHIDDLEITIEKFDKSLLPDEMPTALKEQIADNMKDQDIIGVKTVHIINGGKRVVFGMHDESDGTQKIFSLAAPWMDVLEHGQVIIVDELNDSLHPQMVKFLVSKFNDAAINKLNSQLVFTTHDTSILDQKVLRRDQIWFVTKKNDKSTNLYPLTDYSPKKDKENLERNYLDGRYGALPFFKDIVLNMEQCDNGQ